VRTVLGGEMGEEEWPALFASRHVKDEEMEVSRLAKLWHGETDDEYGKMSVIGTAAIALKSLRQLGSMAEAEKMATEFWESRDRSYVERAA